MKLTCDPRYNVAYIRLRKKGKNIETIRVSDELNIDLAPDGTIYGIELLNAHEQLSGDQKGKLLIANEAAGTQSAVRLAI